MICEPVETFVCHDVVGNPDDIPDAGFEFGWPDPAPSYKQDMRNFVEWAKVNGWLDQQRAHRPYPPQHDDELERILQAIYDLLRDEGARPETFGSLNRLVSVRNFAIVAIAGRRRHIDDYLQMVSLLLDIANDRARLPAQEIMILRDLVAPEIVSMQAGARI
ncbi:hypothetical protein [Rhizobium rhizoryzae]|uniref:Uncharacterized protein n=1 Tax=Rhizobium rhizoryzae TaxID=451876 RepID=A0A7W6LML2_9HYPH|nr:hypothetical protein [Rhizobium rhizoryzae]MBB4146002.1 hypothetical protein [Rhizobium rhizoryzae]